MSRITGTKGNSAVSEADVGTDGRLAVRAIASSESDVTSSSLSEIKEGNKKGSRNVEKYYGNKKRCFL